MNARIIVVTDFIAVPVRVVLAAVSDLGPIVSDDDVDDALVVTQASVHREPFWIFRINFFLLLVTKF